METVIPTAAQMEEYRQKLPSIYKDIMSAFPAEEPRRRAGYGLTLQALVVRFSNTQGRITRWTSEEVKEACYRLIDSGFLKINERELFTYPTALGERLITALTGLHPVTEDIGVLPPHPWRKA